MLMNANYICYITFIIRIDMLTCVKSKYYIYISNLTILQLNCYINFPAMKTYK